MIVYVIDCIYYSEMTKKLIGYMITWTTYGSWLQGDKRGYVKNGQIFGPNEKLKLVNQSLQKYPIVKLNSRQK